MSNNRRGGGVTVVWTISKVNQFCYPGASLTKHGQVLPKLGMKSSKDFEGTLSGQPPRLHNVCVSPLFITPTTGLLVVFYCQHYL